MEVVKYGKCLDFQFEFEAPKLSGRNNEMIGLPMYMPCRCLKKSVIICFLKPY